MPASCADQFSLGLVEFERCDQHDDCDHENQLQNQSDMAYMYLTR